jgi:hypothetical protein
VAFYQLPRAHGSECPGSSANSAAQSRPGISLSSERQAGCGHLGLSELGHDPALTYELGLALTLDVYATLDAGRTKLLSVLLRPERLTLPGATLLMLQLDVLQLAGILHAHMPFISLYIPCPPCYHLSDQFWQHQHPASRTRASASNLSGEGNQRLNCPVALMVARCMRSGPTILWRAPCQQATDPTLDTHPAIQLPFLTLNGRQSSLCSD